MNQSARQHRRWRLAAVAVAGALVAAFGLAAPASAAPVINPVNPDTAGSLVVHKRLNPTGELAAGNGLVDEDAPGTPLNGVQFTIQKLTDVDLMTRAGWTAAGAATDALPAAPSPLGDPVSQSTATNAEGDGTAVFRDLAIGAYYVTETLTAAQIAEGVTPAAPFIVTVPFTHPTDLDTWLYDVHVYPKNLQTTPVKTVDDGPGTTYEVGDAIEWTVSARVPAQATTFYAFKDVLVADLAIDEPGDVAVTIGDTALASGDYQLFYPATAANLEALGAPAPATATPNTLVVSLTDSGLVKLNAAAGSDARIALTFATTILSLPADGVIANTGAVFPNAGFPIEGPGITTETVESRFGQIDILKTDSETKAGLGGAEFMVFTSEAAARAYASDPVANAALPLEARQNGSGALTNTFVTNGEGKVSIVGLRASNWQDGALLTNPADYQNYWLLETKAPSGHELLTAPFGPVSVLYDAEATTLPLGTTAIENVEKLDLPLTGGTLATWLVFLAGGLIVVSGTVLAIRTRARNAQA